jgi:8-oxo-dGTP pyrophosphatase MutT (NUDIX family)
MKDPFVIPSERLPPGFAEQLDHPPASVVQPKPAATAVLIRNGATEPEVLLLKRHRSSGFVPGAYVFPGGRVDAADADVPWPGGTSEPAGEYWIAAVREMFEETGVLLARTRSGAWSWSASDSLNLDSWRERLMTQNATLGELLTDEQLTLDPGAIVYIAHWITPEPEPRRYDTRFFLAEIPAAVEVQPDAREMTDAIWLSPRLALARFEAGALPMVFPTVKTLQRLTSFASASAAIDAFRDCGVQPILPRLVRTAEGVGIVIDQEGE